MSELASQCLVVVVRCRSMAPEAVHRHADEAMAAVTELTGRVDPNRLAPIVPARVAADASPEAVPLGTNAAMHGLVALVKQELHVVAAHHRCRLYALLTVATLNIGQGDANFVGRGLHTRDQHVRKQSDSGAAAKTGSSSPHSPMPMSMYPDGHTSAQMWQPMHLV